MSRTGNEALRPSTPEHADRRLRKPFAGLEPHKLRKDVKEFVTKSGLGDFERHFINGAFLAQDNAAFKEERPDGLTLDDDDKAYLDMEHSDSLLDRFRQPRKLYMLVICCSLGAAVQGWYEKS